MRTSTLGFILAVVFFVIGLIGTLGEWVFHWWDAPFDVVGPLSLILSAVTLMWSASARDLERLRSETAGFRKESAAGQASLGAGQADLIRGQAEQTSLLRELVASFRRP